MARKRRVCFELPFTMDTPRLTNEGLGIHRVVVRPDNTYEMLITLLDAPDHRLLRAGVMLAHRVQDGLGDWYLDAPDWGPWLPKEHAEPMGAAGDLPGDLAELVRPFRRRAALGPVAAVHVQRHTYMLKDNDDVSLGTLRDELITIRRNGLTVSRFREVAINPSPAMTGTQRRFLADALRAVGGIQIDEFPPLVQRLGAPATGLSDYPEPRSFDAKATLEVFTSQLLATRLHDIMRADLALRAGELARQAAVDGADDATGEPSASATPPADTEAPGPGVAPLLSELSQLRHQIGSLAPVLDPSWREALDTDLVAVLDMDASRSITTMNDRYYAVLDALISAVRAPLLGHRGHEQAAPVLRRQLESGLEALEGRCERLTPRSPDADWDAALVATRELLGTTEGVGLLFGKLSRKIAKQLRRMQALLEPAQPVPDWPTPDEMAAWSPDQIFEAGRRLQRAGDVRDAARRTFCEEWTALGRKLAALRGD